MPQNSTGTDDNSHGTDFLIGYGDGFADDPVPILESNYEANKELIQDIKHRIKDHVADPHLHMKESENVLPQKKKSRTTEHPGRKETFAGFQTDRILQGKEYTNRKKTLSDNAGRFCKDNIIAINTIEENSQCSSFHQEEAFSIIREVNLPGSQCLQPSNTGINQISQSSPLKGEREKSEGNDDHVKSKNNVPENNKISPAEDNKSREKKLKLLFKHKRVARMICLVVITYVICWFPYVLFAIIRPFCSNCVPHAWWSFIYGFTYVNSTANPFCYAFANKKFRKTFKRILCFFKKRRL